MAVPPDVDPDDVPPADEVPAGVPGDVPPDEEPGVVPPAVVGCPIVTLSVTVTGAESCTDPLHADSRQAEMATTAVANR